MSKCQDLTPNQQSTIDGRVCPSGYWRGIGLMIEAQGNSPWTIPIIQASTGFLPITGLLSCNDNRRLAGFFSFCGYAGGQISPYVDLELGSGVLYFGCKNAYSFSDLKGVETGFIIHANIGQGFGIFNEGSQNDKCMGGYIEITDPSLAFGRYQLKCKTWALP